ncbi:MAG: lamin tail domain-containing protein, partial [Planctomycetota bacterium]
VVHERDGVGPVLEAREIEGDRAAALLVAYNGANGQPYDTILLSGVVGDDEQCRGTIAFDFPSLQNGPDAIALVNDFNDVLHFIAYEDDVTATTGPAAGMTAQAIGVVENSSTPIGHSIQLSGMGADQDDFTWNAPAVESPGTFNSAQIIEGGCIGVPAQATPTPSDPWINEFHYDNAGGDQGEFVEVAGAAGTSLSGWSVYAYNGSNQRVYASVTLAGVIDNESNNAGALSFPFAGLQNGPDAIALVDATGAVVDFIAYESTFTALDSPAVGMTADLLPVYETSSTPVGRSLQRTNGNCSGGTPAWTGPATDSPGNLNAGQTVDCN